MGRYTVLTVTVSVGAILVLAGFKFSGLRLDADARAKGAFTHLNFFADGRGMHLIPGLIEVFDKYYKEQPDLKIRDGLLHGRWGFNLENHWPVGLFDEEYKGMRVGVLGCVACHSGRAAGQFIIGLGNKNIDVYAIGRDATFIESIYKNISNHPRTDPDYLAVRDSALEFAALLSNQKISNTTQGMVPVSFIRSWFYKNANLPIPKDMTRGAVKVPSLWGYGEKRKIGQFSDGYGNGTFPGWAVAVELTGGQQAGTVRAYLSKIEGAENLFSDFLPPKYPFTIDNQRALEGKDVFNKTCLHCHGAYEKDQDGLALYEAPKWIPLSVVKTDDDRLAANTPFFDHLVEISPLNDVLKHTDYKRGFFAPRLVGIWSRFPYLHNGSIPNIASLLTPPSKRPRVFSVRDAGERYRFDSESLGLNLVQIDVDEENTDSNMNSRVRYNTDEIGHSNQGHPFGIDLSKNEKAQLIEYLKTL